MCQDYLTPVGMAATFLVSSLNLLAFAGCCYFIFVILSKKRLRDNTFNLYVVFLIIPDALHTLFSCIFTAARGIGCTGYVPPLLTSFFNFVLFFYYFCNFYLNSCVAYELKRLLERSSKRMKTKPPPMKRLSIQVGCVYLGSFLFSLWQYLDVPWSFWDGNNFGSPGDDGVFSELAAIILVASLMMIPIIYVVAIRILVWKKDLLPKKGSARNISLFFERIIVVFLTMYLPSVILNTVITTLPPRSASFFWLERIIHLLNAVSATLNLYMACYKSDIRNSVLRRRGSSAMRLDASSTMRLRASSTMRFPASSIAVHDSRDTDKQIAGVANDLEGGCERKTSSGQPPSGSQHEEEEEEETEPGSVSHRCSVVTMDGIITEVHR